MEFRCDYISNTIKCYYKLTVGKTYVCEYENEFKMSIVFKDDNGDNAIWNINDYSYGMTRIN